MPHAEQQPQIIAGLVRQSLRIIGRWPWRLLGVLGVLLLTFALALVGYQATARPVTIYVDGKTIPLQTHHRLVGKVLDQAGLSLESGDVVFPPSYELWQPGQPIVVQRNLPIVVRADGQEIRLYGRPKSLLEVLTRAQIALRPHDAIYVNSLPFPESAYADEGAIERLLSQRMATGRLAAPLPPISVLQIEIKRAIPLFVYDNGVKMELRTTGSTLGEALEEAGFRLYRADRISPDLDTPVNPGVHAYITRAMPVQITVEGHSYTTRTHAQTVNELLEEEGILLGTLDRIEPSSRTPLSKEMVVRIVRVTTFDLTEAITIPYQYRQEPDPNMELDHHYLQPGEEGLKEKVTRITYEDGDEVEREYLGERVHKEPVDEVFFYGTQIVIRTLETPDGPIEYWRKLRMLATSYYPSTCDKAPDHPLYGITYTGKWATRGIIAIDPRVIPFHTRMYVPGYGFGAAEDIGGAIKGMHIDLCFDDADWGKGLWSTRYVDVYLLTPVPPQHRIPWIIPP